MRSKEQILKDIGNPTASEATRSAARAELDALMAQEALYLFQQIRENFYEVFAGMGGEVLRFREALSRAAEDSARTSRWLTCWTAVMAAGTVALAAATVALVWATLRLAHP